MATLYITEFADATATWSTGSVQAAHDPPVVANNNVAIGGGSLQSNPFNIHTRYIRIHSDSICSILIGINPVATTNDGRFAANQTEYRGVRPFDKIAVIANV